MLYTHAHVPDFSLWYGNHIHWQHNRDKCIRLHSENKVVQREGDMGWTAASLMDMHVLLLSQIMTRAPHCSALWWQRTSVGSLSTWWQVRRGPSHTISRYTVSLQQTLLRKMEFLYKSLIGVCFSRLSRGSWDARDYSRAFPFRCVHRPHSAGCVEGAGVGPWPQRGGQVRGRAVKGEMADGTVYNQKSNHGMYFGVVQRWIFGLQSIICENKTNKTLLFHSWLNYGSCLKRDIYSIMCCTHDLSLSLFFLLRGPTLCSEAQHLLLKT